MSLTGEYQEVIEQIEAVKKGLMPTKQWALARLMEVKKSSYNCCAEMLSTIFERSTEWPASLTWCPFCRTKVNHGHTEASQVGMAW